MSFIGYLRMLWLPFMGVALFIAVLLIAAYVIKKFWTNKTFDETKIFNLIVGIIIAVVIVVFAVDAIYLASANLMPHTTLDRSVIDQQNQQWIKTHSSPTPTPTK